MAIGDRIKIVRGGLSRDKFAPQTDISKTTLVNYETGERNPPSDYLLKILEQYPDISPAWLLTGEGEMKRHKPIIRDSENPENTLTKKYRKIRGNLTVSEFAKRLSLTENQVELLERGELIPDVYLLSSMCFHFNINSSWLIDDMGPMTKNEMEKRPQSHINRQSFIFALRSANAMKKVFKESGRNMTEEQWIVSVIGCYETSLNYEALVNPSRQEEVKEK